MSVRDAMLGYKTLEELQDALTFLYERTPLMDGLGMYDDGSYASKNPDWHEDDAPWKARQVLSMLDERNFQPESIVDIVAVEPEAC